MDLFEAMSTLRAVRRLRPDPVPEDVLRRVLEAATWAPSGGNVQPWRVIVVRDPERKLGLRDLYIEEWRTYTSLHRLRMGSLSEEEREKTERILRSGDQLAERFHEAPAILVFCFNPSQMALTDSELDRPSIVAGASVYPAVENCLLACRALGLGCTITTLLCAREADVVRLLEIPAGWYTAAVVPIGYPEAGGHGPISRRPVERMSYEDRWGRALFSEARSGQEE